MSTTKRHVTFESWCERDHLIAFDYDPGIVSIAAQPFEFEFTDTDDRRQRPHTGLFSAHHVRWRHGCRRQAR